MRSCTGLIAVTKRNGHLERKQGNIEKSSVITVTQSFSVTALIVAGTSLLNEGLSVQITVCSGIDFRKDFLQ